MSTDIKIVMMIFYLLLQCEQRAFGFRYTRVHRCTHKQLHNLVQCGMKRVNQFAGVIILLVVSIKHVFLHHWINFVIEIKNVVCK